MRAIHNETAWYLEYKLCGLLGVELGRALGYFPCLRNIHNIHS